MILNTKDITSSNKENLLGIPLDSKLNFDFYINISLLKSIPKT